MRDHAVRSLPERKKYEGGAPFGVWFFKGCGFRVNFIAAIGGWKQNCSRGAVPEIRQIDSDAASKPYTGLAGVNAHLEFFMIVGIFSAGSRWRVIWG